MSVEISITINDSRQPLSSLGKAARELSSGSCPHCQGECSECGEVADEKGSAPSSLGATAQKYSKDGIRKSAIDIFDLRKEDRSNEYEDPKKVGSRTK